MYGLKWPSAILTNQGLGTWVPIAMRHSTSMSGVAKISSSPVSVSHSFFCFYLKNLKLEDH